MSSWNSFEKRFAGKEDEVIATIKLLGIAGAMNAYGSCSQPSNGARSRRAFMRWVKKQTGVSLYPNKLAGMSGGMKAKWIRDHRETVMDCLSNFGEDFVMENFHLNQNTLHDLSNSEPFTQKPFTQKLNRIDRVELKANSALSMAEEALQKGSVQDIRIDVIAQGLRANSQEIAELKEQFAKFTQGVGDTLREILIDPIVQRLFFNRVDESMKLPESFDPLNLEGLSEKLPAKQGRARVKETEAISKAETAHSRLPDSQPKQWFEI